MGEKKESIKDLIRWARHYLNSKKINNPQLTAEIIAENITGKEKINLYLDRDTELSKEQKALFKKNIRRCGRKIPLAYITGEQYFMGYRFLIRPGIFIPRPETEILVEKAIQFLEEIKKNHPARDIIVVDIGTGSGNIAISIAKKIKNAFIYAVDVSSLALEVAKNNAKAHRVHHQIDFLLGDLFSPLKEKGLEGRADLIVSNPPYVEEEKIRNLPEEVKKEPTFSLNGGREGVTFYKKIIPTSPRWLKKGGVLMLEIGYNQLEKVAKIIYEVQEFVDIPQIFYDLEGIARVISVRKK